MRKIFVVVTALLVFMPVCRIYGEREFNPKWINGLMYQLDYSDSTAWVGSNFVHVGHGELDTNEYYGDISIPSHITYRDVLFTVTGINSAFYDTQVTTLHIPATVEWITSNSFINMQCLKNVTVDEANPMLMTDDGILYSRDKKQLWLYPALRTGMDGDEDKRYEEFVVPEGVEEIYSGFLGSGLKKISLPTTLKKLNGGGLSCETLTEITLPKSLEYIGPSCFADTQIPSALHIPDNVSCIEYTCIARSLFTSVNVPEGITHLKPYTFSNSPNLESVTLSEKLEKIDMAFDRCRKLTHIYCLGPTPPEVDSSVPLGLEKNRLGKVIVHVRPGYGEAYMQTPWKEVGPIVEDLECGVEEIGEESAILDDELCDAYTIAGAAMASNIKYSEMRANLTKGLYIIRTASGKTAKIAVE